MARQIYGRRHRRNRSIGGPAFVSMICVSLLLGWYGSSWIDDQTPLIGQMPSSSASSHDQLAAQFGYCHSGGGRNCVVDGDTFWFDGEKYRIADIDTPETHGPSCATEAALGTRATQRLQMVLNDGPFSLESGDRDTDRYGRSLRMVMRGGQSIGGQLVAEGLARPWDGARHPWC